MKTIAERLTENIENWEARGRGALVFSEPVSPKPPFAPFPGHRLHDYHARDDGVRHTAVSGWLSKLSSLVRGEDTKPPSLPEISEDEQGQIEPEVCSWEHEYAELRMRLPLDDRTTRDSMVPFLASLSLANHPLAFEFIGTSVESWVQWAVSPDDEPHLSAQLQAHFPGVKVTAGAGGLEALCRAGTETVVVEMALGKAFMWPLATVKHDLFVTLAGALDTLTADEAGILQVIFTPVFEPWAESTLAAVTKANGTPFFDDGGALVKAAVQKTEGQLYGTVVRLAAVAEDDDHAWLIIRRLAAALRHFSRPDGNEFVPLQLGDSDELAPVMDLILRQTRRSGMLLNLDELTGLVHLPTATVKSPKFKRINTSSRAADSKEAMMGSVCLGINRHDGVDSEVWLQPEQRTRHCHLIGGTGTGKSTLLFAMIRQDILAGQGIAVLDPHGDLIDRVLGIIPPERWQDVVLLDPANEQFVIPFNILSAHSDFEKQLLASDLVSVFQRLSMSWGDQMNSVFQNAILAFLESREGGTLADVRRFLIDAEWRQAFLTSVTDPDVRFYWQRTFPQLGSGRSIGPILTRLETFLSPKPIRYMVSQSENRLDFSAMMDGGKIFLAKLPQGMIGRENAFLLGSLLMTKLQQTAMSRARLPAAQRRAFYCYIDEFHHFITPSLAEILSGARKYGLGLVLAHQDLKQLDRDKDVGSAVLSNALTRVVFRVSDGDARALADGFAHFEPHDLQSLSIGDAICRIERADRDFNLSVQPPAEVDEQLAAANRQAVMESSHATYAIPRSLVEAEHRERFAEDVPLVTSKPKKARDGGASVVSASQPTSMPVEQEALDEVKAVVAPDKADEDEGPVAISSTSAASTTRPHISQQEPGKGGYQHRILQDRIRSVAEQQGFRTVLEMPTRQGRESIDVGIIRSDLRIACEISVTTSVDHEVGNVRKCLREGFDWIAVITGSERRLRQIEAAVISSLDTNEAAKVRYFQPNDFLRHLATLHPPAPVPEVPSAPASSESVRKGWKVKRVFAPLTPEERAIKEAAAFKLLAEEMRLPPGPPT